MKKYYIILLLILFIFIFGCARNDNTQEINQLISQLENVDNDYDRMMQIIVIKKEISENKTKKIDISTLNDVEVRTEKNIRNSIDSVNSMDKNDIYTFSDIFHNNKIIEIAAIDSNYLIKLLTRNRLFIENFQDSVNLAYLNITDDNYIFYEEYQKVINFKNDNYFKFKIISEKNELDVLLEITNQGYIKINLLEKNEKDSKIINAKTMISLIPIESKKIKDVCFDNITSLPSITIEQINAIKEYSLEYLKEHDRKTVSIYDIEIINIYGKFDDVIIFQLGNRGAWQVITPVYFDGFVINFRDSNIPLLLKNGIIYELDMARKIMSKESSLLLYQTFIYLKG